MREHTEGEWDNHFKHGRRLRSPRAAAWREGLTVPMVLWKCWECGRHFRGDVRLQPHLDRTRHGFATGVRPNNQK